MLLHCFVYSQEHITTTAAAAPAPQHVRYQCRWLHMERNR